MGWGCSRAVDEYGRAVKVWAWWRSERGRCRFFGHLANRIPIMKSIAHLSSLHRMNSASLIRRLLRPSALRSNSRVFEFQRGKMEHRFRSNHNTKDRIAELQHSPDCKNSEHDFLYVWSLHASMRMRLICALTTLFLHSLKVKPLA